MDMFWKFADVIRALALIGAGFALFPVSAMAGFCVGGAGAISLADIHRNNPAKIRDALTSLQGKR